MTARSRATALRSAELDRGGPPPQGAGKKSIIHQHGDATARPVILEMLNSKTEAIRAMAARSLSGLDQPEIAQDAGSVAVLIAEKISGGNKSQVRAVMEKVAETVQSEKKLKGRGHEWTGRYEEGVSQDNRRRSRRAGSGK